jgi:hypothetical protein
MAQSKIQLGSLQIGIILLTIATALVHLWLGISDFDPMFLLNGMGYLAILGALYLPIPPLSIYRPIIRWALIAFVVVTILGWLAIGLRIPLAYIDKVGEVILIGLLFTESRQK